MSKFMPVVYFVFAVALIGGGAMGSRVSGTWHSIGGALGFGIVAALAGFLVMNGSRTGLLLGLVDALAVGGFFVYRYMSTGKTVPAFPSIAMALIVAGLTVAAMASAKGR